MSWKSLAYVAMSVVFFGSAAMAQPTLNVTDGGLNSSGNREFEVWAIPATADGTRSLAAEVGFTAAGSTILSATVGESWNDDGIGEVGNPGSNNFTGNDKFCCGIDIRPGNTEVFAALGSAKLNGDELMLTIELDGEIGTIAVGGAYGLNGRIAEHGVNHDTYSGSHGINGDYDQNNDVNLLDFAKFGADWKQNVDDNPVAARSDFDNSGGEIGLLDFAKFGANWGMKASSGASSSSAVPEPASIALIGIALAGLAIRRRLGN